MRTIALAFAVLASIVATVPTATEARDARQNFTLVNSTGYEIREVYVSPSKANTWEEDVMGDDNLADGESAHISFDRAAKSCLWDLKVVYADDDSSAVWHDINLCKVATITLHYNRKTDKTSVTLD